MWEYAVIRQFTKYAMDVNEMPYQDIKPMLRQALVRNRTMPVSNTRHECEGLDEIDEYASRPTHKALDEEGRMELEIVRTEASWNRTKVFWARHVGDWRCPFCKKRKDDAAHTVWTCEALQREREEIDQELAKC